MIPTAFLADVALKGALILAVATALAPLFRRASAATRHMLWTVALVSVACLPLLKAGLPQWAPPGSEVLAVAAVFGSPRAGLPADAAPVRTEVTGRRSADEWPPAAAAGEQAGRAGTASPTGAPPSEGDARAGVANAAASDPAAPRSASSAGAARDQPPASPAGERERAGLESAGGAVADGASQGGALPGGAILAGVWLLGLFATAARSLMGAAAVRRVAHAGRRVEDGPIAAEAGRLAREAGVPLPRLILAADHVMPMAWGVLSPAIALPASAGAWSTRRLRAVLRHELAHLRRRDPLTQWVGELVCAVHWFNPFAWHAARRLRDERELACDDEVLLRTPRASEYAAELVGVARTMRVAMPAPALSIARPSQLAKRVRAVLDGERNRAPQRPAFMAGCLIGAALVVSPLAAAAPASTGEEPSGENAIRNDADEPAGAPVTGPAAGAASASLAVAPPRLDGPSDGLVTGSADLLCWEDDWKGSRTHNVNDERHRVQWESGDCELDLRVEGEVRFTSELDGIEYMEPGALFRLREDDGDTRRELEAVPGRGGTPVYTYRYEGDEAPFDGEARRWFGRIVLKLARESGFGAVQRVAGLLRDGGPDAVLTEIGLLGGDWVRSLYFGELVDQAALDPAQVTRALRLAGSRIGSDHYLATVAAALADEGPMSAEGRDALVATVQSLESDHYRAQVLGRALESGALGPRGVQTLLDAVAQVDSDHYVAEILTEAARTQGLESADRDAYIQIARSMDSDHYRAEVLVALLEAGGDGVADAVASAIPDAMESGHYIAEVTTRLVAGGLGPEGQEAFVRAVAMNDSDHYRALMLRALLDADPNDPASVATVIVAARAIDSDHYLAEVLEAVSSRVDLEGALLEEFRETLDRIESDTYHRRVSRRLGGR